MKIKKIKCPNCDANISIKENETRGVCEYCNSEFIIDDETIKIEHTGTIEVTDDTSLKVANTTLNQFKDYDKSLLLYKRLLYKYAHKKEVYIGLIRSITRDFSIDNLASYQLNEINDYFKKYTSLATDKEIKKYEEHIKTLNKNYWYTTLVKGTNNFDATKNGEDVDVIESYHKNYLKYCSKDEKIKLETQYKKYITDYKLFVTNRDKKKKNIIKLIIGIIIAILLISIIFLLTENTKGVTKSIKLSEINEHYYVTQNDYQYFKKYFKDTFSEMKITDVKLNNNEKTVSITVSLKNVLIDKKETFEFDIIDDMGPVISPLSCKFTDTEEVNIYDCFTLYDFTDGVIDVKEANIKVEGIDFKTVGTKSINVVAKDKDGNESSLDISVIITKTPIELKFNLSEKLTVNKTYNLSYSITPNNVSDTSVKYTYDKNLIKIKNGKLTPLKKGQTEVCAVSNYNSDVKVCKNVKLELQCKDTYTFSFDGSKEETITSDEVFCPGTYRIYASVMNSNEFYHLKITPKGEFSGDTLTIYKNSSFLNEEGSKYALTSGYTITTDIGITKVRLVKQK